MAQEDELGCGSGGWSWVWPRRMSLGVELGVAQEDEFGCGLIA